MKDFLLLTKDDTFVAINLSFIYPTKTTTNFIDEDHRPTLRYNLTLKYHDPSKDDRDNKLPQQSHKNDQIPSEGHKYFQSENQQPDAKQHFPDEPPKTHICDDTEVANHVTDDVLSTRRATVEQSIKRRNVLIQRLLDSQIDPPISPRKQESIRFVDVVSPPPPQAQPETYRRIDDDISPSRIRIDRFDSVFTPPPPVALETYCRSPKSVSFNPQPQSDDDFLIWKSKQQEVFLTGSKKKDNEHLKSMAEEWLIRQTKEEDKLDEKMKKCKLLTLALEQGLSTIEVIIQFIGSPDDNISLLSLSFKEKNTISMDHQKLDEERKRHSDEKISALTDQIRRMAIDHDYQLKLMESKHQTLYPHFIGFCGMFCFKKHLPLYFIIDSSME